MGRLGLRRAARLEVAERAAAEEAVEAEVLIAKQENSDMCFCTKNI